MTRNRRGGIDEPDPSEPMDRHRQIGYEAPMGPFQPEYRRGFSPDRTKLTADPLGRNFH